MRARRIHQVLVGAGPGDAITSMATRVRERLADRHESEIFAHFVATEVAADVRPLRDLGPGRRDDVIIYHASYGAPEVTRALLDRPERLVVAYHNITPSVFFLAHEPQFAAGLQWGRHELSLLRDRTVLAIADSAFNAGELEHEGYRDVHVVPAGLHPARLRSVAPDPSLAGRLHAEHPHGYVLSVSQVLPHKRFEDLVAAMHLVQWVHDVPLGLVVVGAHRMPGYLRALERFGRSLRVQRVWFAGGVAESSLATLFRMAAMHVTTSVHEGLALPPLEAMSFGVPVIARDAGALGETLAGAGLLLPSSAGPALLSEAIVAVHRDQRLRNDLVARGLVRCDEVEARDTVGQFVALLEQAA